MQAIESFLSISIHTVTMIDDIYQPIESFLSISIHTVTMIDDIYQPVRLLVNDRKFTVRNSVSLSHQTSQQ